MQISSFSTSSCNEWGHLDCGDSFELLQVPWPHPTQWLNKLQCVSWLSSHWTRLLLWLLLQI